MNRNGLTMVVHESPPWFSASWWSYQVRRPEVQAIAIAVFLYLCAVPVARLTVFPEADVALFWFPTAIFVGLIARLPTRCLVAVVPAVMLAEFTGTQIFEGVSLGSVWLWVAATTFEAVAVGLALKLVGANRMRQPRDLVLFAVVVPLVVAVSASIGGLAVSASFGTGWFLGFRGWWLGDVSGILIATPFLLAISRPPVASLKLVLEYAGLSAVTVAIAAWIFLTPGTPTDFILRFALLVPMLGWIALRFGVAAVAAVTPLVVLLAAVSAANSLGPYQGTVPNIHLLVPTQALLVVTCLTVYAAGTVTEATNRAEAKLRSQLRHDDLTGLANRRGMLERIGELPPTGVPRAVLFCDLRGFKQVNDTLGHSAGDEALVETSRRMESVVGDSGLVARFGGDEFVVLVHDAQDHRAVTTVARRLVESISGPLSLRGTQQELALDIGIAFEGADDGSSGDLAIHADLALLAAKNSPIPTTQVFSRALERQLHLRVETEAFIRRAVENRWVETWLQPLVDTRTEHTVGAEALVRIRTPDGKIHVPHEFIDVAEDSGVIVPMGKLVLESALDWLREHDTFHPAVHVAVNVSARQLADEGFGEYVMGELESREVPPWRLVLEVTERIALGSHPLALHTLKSLRLQGVRVAIDDFGTGYSSLTALRQVPAHVIKVDRSFISGLLDDPEDQAIVSAIVHVAHDLHKQVVAEGVETAAQARAVTELGAEFIQGFHYGRPVPADQFQFRDYSR